MTQFHKQTKDAIKRAFLTRQKILTLLSQKCQYLNLLKNEIKLNYVERLSPYRAENTLHICCKTKSVNAV